MHSQEKRERISFGEFVNNLAFMAVACTAIYTIVLGRYVKDKFQCSKKESK